MRAERWEILALVAILVLALALRIVGLNAPLWYDEVFTLTHFVRQPLGRLLTDFSSLNNHMLYSIEAKAAVALFGESAWALRLPAMLFGLGSLIMLWLLGRKPAGALPALVAVFLGAIAYHHVWFSQDARGYTELLFLTSFATWLFLRGMEQPSRRTWTAYGLTVAAAMYTHLSAGFFLAAHGVVALAMLTRDKRGWKPVYGFVVGGVLTLLLHLPIISQVMGAMNEVSKGKTESKMAEWVNPLRMVSEIVDSLGALGVIAPLALGGGLLVIVVGAVSLCRRAPVFSAIHLLSIPIALALLVALSFRIWPRYFFVDILYIFLCIAVGLDVLTGWATKLVGRSSASSALYTFTVFVTSVALAFLLVRNYKLPKQDLAGAVQFVQRNKASSDVATSIGLASEPIRTYFAPEWPVLAGEDDLTKLSPRSGRLWIITAFDDHVGPEQTEALNEMHQSFEEVREFQGTLSGGIVRVYRSRKGFQHRKI